MHAKSSHKHGGSWRDSRMDRSSIILRLHCQTCGEPVTVQYEQESPVAPAMKQPWFCPRNACSATETARLHGFVTRAWLGHGPEPKP